MGLGDGRMVPVVMPSQGSFKKQPKLDGGISAIAEAEEEVVTHSRLLVLSATGEAKDLFCHAKY
jgi:hypothetical protein